MESRFLGPTVYYGFTMGFARTFVGGLRVLFFFGRFFFFAIKILSLAKYKKVDWRPFYLVTLFDGSL